MFVHSENGFQKIYSQAQFHILSPVGFFPLSSSSGTAKKCFKNIRETASRPLETGKIKAAKTTLPFPASSLSSAKAGSAELVVLRSFLFVSKYFVSGINLFKLFSGTRLVFIEIRM